jgi:hypothetical protein
MRNAKRLVWLATMLLAGNAAAEGFGLSANVSSLGLGLDLTKAFTPGINGRLGINTYKYDKSVTESGIDYNGSFKWQSAHLLADWYPYQGVFRTSIGLVYNNNKLSLSAKPSAGTTYTINGTTYTTTDIGSLNGEMTFNKSAPYLGIGWGNPVAQGKGWGFVADVGVLYQGAPKTTLNVNCTATTPGLCSTLNGDVAAQNAKLTSDLNSFRWYPVLSVGASYQF